MLELWGMRSTSLLPLLPGPLWPGMEAPDKVLSMAKLRTYAKLNCLKKNCFWNRNCTELFEIELFRHLTVCNQNLYLYFILNWIRTDDLILIRRPDRELFNKETRTCGVDFAVPTDHRVKIKENERIDDCLDLAWAHKNTNKKLWNIKLTMIPFVAVALGTKLGKRLEEQKIRRRIKTIQTTPLLRSAGILRQFGRPEETCCHSDSCGSSQANIGVKNLSGVE